MKKKVIVIISLISAVLSFLWLILNYYGITRYINLHNANYEFYVSNYSKLQKADDNNRVVVIFTVDDKFNVDKLKPFLLSLLDQTVKVDEIALTVPYKLKGKFNKYKDILNIYYYSVGYPSSLKGLIPTLLREEEGNTKIIVVDPDVIYGKDFIEEIVDLDSLNALPNNKIYKSKNAYLLTPNSLKTTAIEEWDGQSCNNLYDWLCLHKDCKIEDYKYRENYKML